MPTRKSLAVALTIAGSDSGGGAGLQADLKTFAALGVHGTTVITCITAQNPKTISAIQALSPQIVQGQLEAVFEGFTPNAVKTGMLYSAGIIRTAANFLGRHRVPLVVDPLTVSSSGTPLLKPSAVRVLLGELLPLACLITPNLAEAEFLLNAKIRSLEQLRAAARELHKRFGCAAMVKGGHLPAQEMATDVFFDGRREILLSAPFRRGLRTHGTGCCLSAAVTAHLARGIPLARAVQGAKKYVTQAIGESRNARGHSVLGWGI